MKRWLALIFIHAFCGTAAEQKLLLAGNWRFALARSDISLAAHPHLNRLLKSFKLKLPSKDYQFKTTF